MDVRSLEMNDDICIFHSNKPWQAFSLSFYFDDIYHSRKSSVYSRRLLNANVKGQIAFFLGKNKWHANDKSFELVVKVYSSGRLRKHKLCGFEKKTDSRAF